MQEQIRLICLMFFCVMQFSCSRDMDSELLKMGLTQIDNSSAIALSQMASIL